MNRYRITDVEHNVYDTFTAKDPEQAVKMFFARNGVPNAMNVQLIVGTRDGFDFTREELLQAFNRVASRTNWKGPINKVVKIDNQRDLSAIAEGVRFFAGCEAQIDCAEFGDDSLVTAPGYYVAVGA